MRHKLLLVALIVGGLGLTSSSVQAQNTTPDTPRTGTAGASWLLLPTTARSASLGSANTGGISSMSGLEGAIENPANLSLSEGTSVLFSRMNYVADIGVNTFGVAQRFGNSTIGVTVGTWDYGDIPETTDASADITESTTTWTASNTVVGLNYAQIFTDRISAGVNVKLVSERMSEDLSASTIAFDAGMTYTVGESGLRFGVSMRNLAPGMRYNGDGLDRTTSVDGVQTTTRITSEDFELPSLLNFGATYQRAINQQVSMALLGNFRSNSYQADNLSGGLELGMLNTVFVRGGYNWSDEMSQSFFDQGWNVGAGLNLNLSGSVIQVDYAFRPTSIGGNVQMLTASVQL